LSLASMLLLLLAGCASSGNKAPVEERKAAPRAAAPASPPLASASAPAADAKAVTSPASDATGKQGFYTVKPGDTLMRIALDNGQNWRDIARWNGIDKPNLIEVGQVLRVAPPASEAAAATPRGVAPPRVETKPLDGRPVAAASGATAGAASGAASGVTSGAASSAASGATAPTAPVAAAPSAAGSTAPPAKERGDDELNWLWPAAGVVVTPFDETRSKGLAIAGTLGDPVFAAADGRVVYAGSGLRGYGNLVIVKHNNTYLTAYAHNQTLLVKEDQVVQRGQKIAEMGATDAERVQLHFEIRRQGKPVDPAKLLPAR
jgi:lipoprotein NlpD